MWWLRYPSHTRKPVVRGTVLCGYGTFKPVPVPVHTRDRKHTVLPVPVSLLTHDSGVPTLKNAQTVDARVRSEWHPGNQTRGMCRIVSRVPTTWS